MKGFEPSGFFVFRTPLLPVDEFLAWSGGLEAPNGSGDDDGMEKALERDRDRLRSRLREIVARPEVRDAIFVASPSLEQSLDTWVVAPDTKRGRAVERALVRYFSRMTTRPTPFGLFAGCSVGTVADETRLELEPRDEYRRHSRLNMNYLDALARGLAEDPSIRSGLTYRPNSSLYHAAGRVRYVEVRLDGNDRSHLLVAVRETEALRSALDRAERGATPPELAEAITKGGVSEEDARAFIQELIDAQIVVPELAVPMTGRPPLEGLLDTMERYPECATAVVMLERARRELDRIDVSGVGAAPKVYRELAGSLEELPAEIDIQRLFQVDLLKPASVATLGRAVVEEVSQAAELLRRLGGASREEELRRFREAFAERYERREVPLLEALDEDTGVGFGPKGVAGGEPAPLLAGLRFPERLDRRIEVPPHHALLLRILAEATATGNREVVVERTDLEKGVSTEGAPFPGAFSVGATIAAPSEDALRKGAFLIVVEGHSGPSGARRLGRFCHADEQLRKQVEEHLRAEEALDPDALFAEIVHLPEGQLGNVLSRPVMREHEIVYLGQSGAPTDRRIPATDLLVSVADERIVLRSERLGRRVVPRLTSAHNFTRRTLGVYRFLCLLQADGVSTGTAWDWGPLAAAPFLPRVRVGRVVLSPARWRVEGAEIRRLAAPTGADLYRAVREWRAQRKLPRLVLLTEHDNRLMVDLDNVLSVESLVHLLKRREEARLQEVLPEHDDMVTRGPEGRFAHELLIPFVRSEPAVTPQDRFSSPARRAESASFHRTMPPGTEWLYAKLYTGTATGDRVLLEVIQPLVRDLKASGAIDRWFFIRYDESGHHLRVRFHGETPSLLGTVVPTLRDAAAPMLEDGTIWRLQLDTYEREVERYGGPEGVELAERIFDADSEAVLELLGMLADGDAGADERWRLALSGSALLLGDMALGLEEKLALVRRRRDGLAREFRADARLKGQLAERFRSERSSLEPLLDPPADPDHLLAPGFEVFRRRSARLAPLVTELQALDASDALSTSIVDLASSYVHMHVNRMLRSAQRAHELVLYDFLARMLLSVRARADDEERSSFR